MKKILLFLFLVNITYGIEIKTFDQLIEVYRESSRKEEINNLDLDKLEVKKAGVNYAQWKDISLSLNPVFVRGKEEMKKNDLQIEVNYKNFYFKTFYNDSLDISLKESESRILGYENSLSNIFKSSFSIKKDIINLEKERLNLENKIKEIDNLAEVIDYLMTLRRVEVSREIINNRKSNIEEIIEINENLLKINEGSQYEFDFILEEKRYLKKEADLLLVEKEETLNKLKNLFKTNEINFDFFDYDSALSRTLVENKYRSMISIIDEKILNKNLKLSKKRFGDNILLNFEYDFENEISLGQIKFVYKPFEKDFDKEDKKITMEQIIKNRKLVEVEEKTSYELLKIQYEKLLNKKLKSQSEYKLLKKRYEYMKNLYLKGSLNYFIYLKEREKFEEKEKAFRLDEIELISFVLRNSIK